MEIAGRPSPRFMSYLISIFQVPRMARTCRYLHPESPCVFGTLRLAMYASKTSAGKKSYWQTPLGFQ